MQNLTSKIGQICANLYIGLHFVYIGSIYFLPKGFFAGGFFAIGLLGPDFLALGFLGDSCRNGNTRYAGTLKI